MFFQTKNVTISYDAVQAVTDVSISVEKGEVVALIGANGAGKTTLMRAISGLKRIQKGEIWFEDKRIDTLLPHEIVKLGIVQVAEDRKLFPYMSVLDNLKMGAYLQKGRDLEASLEKIYASFPVLKQRSKQLAGTLSGGEQQMLAIARGMMARPKLLLLDEPSLGLSPVMSEEIAHIITEINRAGISIILVEQNARMALTLAQRGYVLEIGKVVLEDTAERLLVNPRVKEAYLGR